MKSSRPPVHIPSPCPRQWEELHGNSRQRFCGQCQKTVHNLSGMNQQDRAQLLRTTGDRVCVAYTTDLRGNFVSPDSPPSVMKFIRRLHLWAPSLLTLIFPFILSSCASRQTTTLGLPAMPPPADHKEIKTVEHEGKMTVTMGDMVIVERPLWKRILWPF